MTRPLLNTSLAISLALHCCVAGIFCLSFGPAVSVPRYAQVSFLGRLFESFDLHTSFKHAAVVTNKLDQTLLASNQSPVSYDLIRSAIKPSVGKSLLQEKADSVVLPDIPKPRAMNKESVVMLYPQLPYNFLLFFKDRQRVHIELMFKVDTLGNTNSITIMRKISSGNLDADLLTMRYIDRYLFRQQARLSSGGWQTVKIDLQPKSER